MSIVHLFRLILAVLCLGMVACSGEPAAPPPATTDTTNTIPADNAAGDSNPAAQAADGTSIAARVNDVPITMQEFQQELARASQQVVAADSNALAASVLDTMIEQAMIEAAAAQRQITVTEEEVTTEFDLNRAQVGTDEEWQQWLAENGFTEDDYRANLRDALLAGKLRDEIIRDMPTNVLQVHARHILVATEQEASDLLTRMQNGEDFAVLAASVSQDVTTREQGGDLGWFAEGELWETALSEAAFSLEPGQIAGPVPTRLGFHVIQVLEREERAVPEERQPILAQITFERWLEGEIANANIERFAA